MDDLDFIRPNNPPYTDRTYSPASDSFHENELASKEINANISLLGREVKLLRKEESGLRGLFKRTFSNKPSEDHVSLKDRVFTQIKQLTTNLHTKSTSMEATERIDLLELVYEVSKLFSRLKGAEQRIADEFLQTFNSRVLQDRESAERFVDSAMDQLSDKFQLNGNEEMLLTVSSMKGFGDILFAVKMAKELKSKLPNLKITIVTDHPKFCNAVQTMLGEESDVGIHSAMVPDLDESGTQQTHPRTKAPLMKPNPLPNDLRRPSLILEGPTRFGENSHAALGLSNRANIPLLEVLEYGYGKPQRTSFRHVEDYMMNQKHRLFSMGVTRVELGLVIDSDLLAYASSSNSQSSENRLQFLNDLSSKPAAQNMKHALLGEHGNVNTYNDYNLLYFGYAHLTKPIMNFVNTVIASQDPPPQGSKNVDICLPVGKVHNDKLNGAVSLSDFDRLDFDKLAEEGFTRVEIVRLPAGTTTFEPVSINVGEKTQTPIQGERVLRLIDPFPLDNTDMKTMLKASEPSCLVTGDQSLTEGISAGKLFFYEKLPHKHEFFRDNIVDLAKEFEIQYGDTILSDFLAKTVSQDKMIPVDDSKENSRDLSQLMRHPDLRSRYSDFCHFVSKNYNGTERLMGKVKRSLVIGNNSKLEKLEKKILKIITAFHNMATLEEAKQRAPSAFHKFFKLSR